MKKKEWEQNINYTIHPRVIIGARACDIHGLIKLDKVLMKGKFPSPYYVSRRKNTFLIGLDHEPQKDCFCRSLDTDVVTHGFDIYMTDIGDKYFLQINSSKAFNLLKNIKKAEITKKDESAFIKEQERIRKMFETKMEITGLSSLMDIEFKSDVWKKYGDKCLSCGSCSMVWGFISL